MKTAWKVLWIVLMSALFMLQQSMQAKNLFSEAKKENIARAILPIIDGAKQWAPDMRTRANVFFLDKKKAEYYIKYQYNMDNFDDRNIRIPTHMGCTGDAWRTQDQVWCYANEIFSNGNYRVPQEWLKTVPKDIKWIVSTPIRVDSDVIAVLNIDGNQNLSEEKEGSMGQQSKRLAEALGRILSD
jgi:hypothetical protein